MTVHARGPRCIALALSLTIVAKFQLSPALAQTGPNDPSPEVIVEGKIRDDLKRVCKQTTATGSILPTRTCKTKAEWEEVRQRSLAQMEQLKDDADRYRHFQDTREAICGPGERC